mmetsp:Transcript_13745/g.33343  ORF Transcript_13745/g.33343 Transcript_13745/m.33343 type:complete len:225 (-) Transcript_13745:287-961(-)
MQRLISLHAHARRGLGVGRVPQPERDHMLHPRAQPPGTGCKHHRPRGVVPIREILEGERRKGRDGKCRGVRRQRSSEARNRDARCRRDVHVGNERYGYEVRGPRERDGLSDRFRCEGCLYHREWCGRACDPQPRFGRRCHQLLRENGVVGAVFVGGSGRVVRRRPHRGGDVDVGCILLIRGIPHPEGNNVRCFMRQPICPHRQPECAIIHVPHPRACQELVRRV